MLKMAAIYNTYGRGNKENIPYYIDAVRSMLAQDLDNTITVISGCCPSTNARWDMEHHFGTTAYFNWITESYPVHVTLNHTVKEINKRFGGAETYLYVDSGIHFWGMPNVFRDLYNSMKAGPNAMVAAKPSNDDGYKMWNIPDQTADYTLPLGHAVNGHCQLYSHDYYENYDERILPDLFCNDTSESIQTMMCAAMGKRAVVNQRIYLMHNHSMDGASIGSRKDFLFMRPNSAKEDIIPIIQSGREFGMGWEECDASMQCPHDPSKFTDEGFATDPRLRDFIRDNLFVPKDVFSYDSVEAEWVG